MYILTVALDLQEEFPEHDADNVRQRVLKLLKDECLNPQPPSFRLREERPSALEREARYRWERPALKIVTEIKDHLLPAMDEEDGGWILGRILDLCDEVRKAPTAMKGDGNGR